MKTKNKSLQTPVQCLLTLTAAITLLSTNHAGAVGAVTSFTSYEAEAGTLGGGASIVSLTSPPTDQYSNPQLEASGHAYVLLNSTGQYVQWANNTGQNITAINLRSCIPDASGGGGTTSTIDLYVNGVQLRRGTISVNSQQNYCYEGTGYNGQTDKNPADGRPRDFWNDTHVFITGAAVSPGQTIRVEKDSANSAAFYYIDVVDLENPPAALSQPANSLSILTYGAVANNIATDNTAAINNCFAAAKSQGKIAWIPSGIFYISAINGALNASGITIVGAGPWYSTIYRVTPSNNSQGIANIISATSCTLSNLSLDCNGSSRAGNNNNGAVNFSGSNWVVDNVWIQHVTSSFWCAGVNGIARNCRVLSVWSDGGNFNNVQDANGVGTGLTYSNNFVRGTGDDAMAINSVNYNGTTFYTIMSNIKYVNNTAIAPWGGKCMGIYGGTNVTVMNNLLCDTARYIGLGVGKFGANGSDLQSATVTGNTVLRGGGNGYSQQQPALQIGNGGDGQSTGNVGNALVSGNTVNNSLYNGVGFSTCNNVNFQNNTVNSPGLNGIVISPANFPAPTGSASITGNTVTGLSSGESAYLDLSSGFNATVTGNSWQSGGGGLVGPTNGVTYHLICQDSGKALDNGGSTTVGTVVNQWANQAGNANQEWKLTAMSGGSFNLVCQKSGMALDNSGSTTNRGSNVKQMESLTWGNANQNWTFVNVGGTYPWHLKCQTGGLSLDNRGSTTDGTAVGQWTDGGSGNPNQNWQLQFIR